MVNLVGFKEEQPGNYVKRDEQGRILETYTLSQQGLPQSHEVYHYTSPKQSVTIKRSLIEDYDERGQLRMRQTFQYSGGEKTPRASNIEQYQNGQLVREHPREYEPKGQEAVFKFTNPEAVKAQQEKRAAQGALYTVSYAGKSYPTKNPEFQPEPYKRDLAAYEQSRREATPGLAGQAVQQQAVPPSGGFLRGVVQGANPVTSPALYATTSIPANAGAGDVVRAANLGRMGMLSAVELPAQPQPQRQSWLDRANLRVSRTVFGEPGRDYIITSEGAIAKPIKGGGWLVSPQPLPYTEKARKFVMEKPVSAAGLVAGGAAMRVAFAGAGVVASRVAVYAPKAGRVLKYGLTAGGALLAGTYGAGVAKTISVQPSRAAKIETGVLEGTKLALFGAGARAAGPAVRPLESRIAAYDSLKSVKSVGKRAKLAKLIDTGEPVRVRTFVTAQSEPKTAYAIREGVAVERTFQKGQINTYYQAGRTKYGVQRLKVYGTKTSTVDLKTGEYAIKSQILIGTPSKATSYEGVGRGVVETTPLFEAKAPGKMTSTTSVYGRESGVYGLSRVVRKPSATLTGEGLTLEGKEVKKPGELLGLAYSTDYAGEVTAERIRTPTTESPGLSAIRSEFEGYTKGVGFGKGTGRIGLGIARIAPRMSIPVAGASSKSLSVMSYAQKEYPETTIGYGKGVERQLSIPKGEWRASIARPARPVRFKVEMEVSRGRMGKRGQVGLASRKLASVSITRPERPAIEPRPVTSRGLMGEAAEIVKAGRRRGTGPRGFFGIRTEGGTRLSGGSILRGDIGGVQKSQVRMGSVSVQTPVERPLTIPKLDLGLREGQVQKPKLDTPLMFQRPPATRISVPFKFTTSELPPPGIPGGLLLPPGGVRGRGSARGRSGRRTKYAPTVFSSLAGIEAKLTKKQKKREELTGLSIRPVTR